MASVKYGAIITELKGSVGGSTFQGGNVGYVLRNKGYTPGLRSTARQAACSKLVARTQAWRNVSRADQLSWNTRSTDWPFTDKYGNTYYGSGYQFYTSLNNNLNSITSTTVSAPPAVTSAAAYGTFTGTYSLAGNLRISWTNVTVATSIISFFGTPAYSAGRNGANLPFKFVYNLASAGDTHLDMQFYYASVFGFPPVGSVIVIRVITRNTTWPIPTNIQDVRIIVTA